jgi:HSP20 family protein
MAVIRWEPIGEINTIQNEMNRLFNTLFDQPAYGGRASGNGARRWIPAMDLVEADDHYILRADLPGLSDEDVNVELQDNVLTVSGERKPEEEAHRDGFYRLERAFGAFSRSLTLPEGINPEGVQAHFDRGVLEITIPKPEQKKPRQVQIKLGAGAVDTNTIDSAETADPQASSRDPVPALT